MNNALKIIRLIFQVILLCSLLSSCLCSPQSIPYNENEIPQPYQYQYGVKDDYTKANFAKTESQDDKVK